MQRGCFEESNTLFDPPLSLATTTGRPGTSYGLFDGMRRVGAVVVWCRDRPGQRRSS